MDRKSEDENYFTEKVWFEATPADACFYIKSEDGISIVTAEPSTANSTAAAAEWQTVSIKSEITFGDFECTPSTDSAPLANNETRKSIAVTGAKKSFICDECGKSFTDKGMLIRHLRCHSGEKPFECDECGMRFSQRCHVKGHKLTHKPVSCIDCGAVFTSRSSLKQHAKQHTTDEHDGHPGAVGGKEYNCDECGRTFTGKQKLTRHKFCHSGVKPFACDKCEMRFIMNYQLKQHKVTHSGEKPFPCDECDKKFYRKASLTLHKRVHSGEKPFGCDECAMRFAHIGAFKAHKLKHSGVKPFACDECGMRFTQKYSFKSHKLKHSGEQPYACDECCSKFTTMSALKQHKMLCSRKSTVKAELETVNINGEMAFGDLYCDPSSHNEIKAEESGHKMQQTEHSGKIGMNSEQKDKMEQQTPANHRSHSGNESFACDICGMRFADKSGIKKHLLTHSGVDECPSDFTSISGLRQHKIRSHPEDGILRNRGRRRKINES